MQARAIPVRTPRRRRARPWRRTPLAALLLSTLALTSPTLTVAPLNASEPGARPLPEIARRIDAPAPRRPLLIEESERPIIFPSSPPAPIRADPGPSFAAALDAARAHGEAYGVAFAAVRDGSVVWAGASGRARDGRTELTPASPLVIGSVTKTFVAATVLQLVDEGRIALDDPLRRHLPQLRQLSDRITVAQLLDHTSGLADLFNDTTRRGLEEEPARSWVAGDVLATLHEPWYEPGEGWAYANTNYYLLAMLVEAVTDAPLTDELNARFLDPLNLEATSVLDGGQVGSPLEEAWTTIFWGSGAMGASAVDLARWGDALYAGDLLSRASRAAMLDFNAHDYGLGVQELEVDGTDGYGHTGLLNTYTTLLFHVPEERVTIALLVNRSHVDLGGMLAAEPPDGPSLLELALDRR
jgi:D-alanyl-D-alanine carboxypeptidase